MIWAQLFMSVCVEVLRPSQPNGVMLSAVSLPNHTFTRQDPSCSKLMMSLVNDSLKFTLTDTQIRCNFLLKKCE